MNLFEHIAAHQDPYEYFYECISGNHGKIAEKSCGDIYNDVSADYMLHPDDDFEKIIEIAVEQLIADFGSETV
jgi:hypothetical protein